jgi:aryl-alcohol dehydrogenase-like predicted oxidoreductase
LGTRRLDRVKENLGAANVTLTAADLKRIEDVFAAIEVGGAPLHHALLQLSYR